MKKRFLNLLLLLICFTLFSGCRGNIENVKTRTVDSEIYTQEEIESAIQTVTKNFKKEYKGCTLTEIYYVGDDSLDSYRDLMIQNKTDEVMVLASSFDVDETGSDGSLEPNSTYCWMWILIKDDIGNWKLLDHGNL